MELLCIFQFPISKKKEGKLNHRGTPEWSIAPFPVSYEVWCGGDLKLQRLCMMKITRAFVKLPLCPHKCSPPKPS